MQKRQKILVIGFLLVVLLAALPNQVNAEVDSFTNYYDDYDNDELIEIEVERADYLDYDNDGYEDDIITQFKIIPPKDEWEGKDKIIRIFLITFD